MPWARSLPFAEWWVGNDNGLHLAVAAGEAHNDGLARCATATLATRAAAANIGLVQFELPGEQRIE